MDVRILGTFRVEQQGRLLSLGGTKQQAVLAMLSLQPNQVVSTDNIVDGLWGESPPNSATNIVQSYVSRLRKIIGDACSTERAPEAGTLRRSRPGYLLELDPGRLDLHRFTQFSLEGARLLTTDPEAASASLRAALDLWRGSPLSEFVNEPFAISQARRLQELWLGALTTRIEADLQLGRHADLVAELEVLVDQHPLHEGLPEHLMVCLFRSGRQAEALAVYRRVQHTFAEELGIEPGRRLAELEAAILGRDSKLDWQPPRSSGVGEADAVKARTESPIPAQPPSRENDRRHKVWRAPARNPHFTGRDELLEQLRLRLTARENTLVVQTLFGLGGVGKTQLAIEYVHRFAADYSIVWWIDAEQPVLIPDQFLALADRLGLPINGNTTDVVERVLGELAERPRWLLIFDNAEHPDHIAGYRSVGAGHVVVTSRFPGWGALGGRLQVEVMSRPETKELLQARIPQMAPEVCESLAAELGDLPLAAAQAAAYLEQTGMPPDDYLRQFRTRRASLLAHGDVVGYQGRVDTAWDLSLDRLRTVNPAAVELLELAAFMAPEPLPFSVFTNRPELLVGSLRSTAAAGSDVLSDAVGAAVAFSLVSRRLDSFQLHRLVQAAIRHRLTPEQQAATGARAGAVLFACHPGDPTDPANWPAFARLAPHVLAIGSLADGSPQGRDLMLATVVYLSVRGDNRASRVIAEELLDHWREVLGSADPATLTLASVLTSALAWLGEAEPARALGEDTLRRCIHTFGPDHPTTLSTATYLTSALAWLGHADRARALGEETLERCRRTLGPDHPTTLASAGQWSFTLLGLDQVDAARSTSQDTWERSIAVLGEDHPTTLSAAAALTISLTWRGEAEAAYPIGERTVAMCSKAFGPEHWLTLIAAAGLAFALVGSGRHRPARDLTTKTVQLSGQAFGPDHWVTLLSAAALTFALVGLGEASEARRVGGGTLDLCNRTLGPTHPIAVNISQQLSYLDAQQNAAP